MNNVSIKLVICLFFVTMPSKVIAQTHTWGLVGTDKIIQARSMCVSPAGVLFATASDGIYQSEDHGINWSFVGKIDPPSNNLIAVDSSGYLYTYGFGISRSTDNGLSWLQIFTADTNVNDVQVSPEGKVFAQAYPYGLRESTDHGLTWQAVPLPGAWYSAFMIDSHENLFVSMEYGWAHGVSRSTDGGLTWHLVYQAMIDHGYYKEVINLMATRNGRMFGSTSRGIILSSDEGSTWHNVSAGLLDTAFVNRITECDNGDLLTQTPYGVYRSTDSARSWAYVVIDESVVSTDLIVTGHGGMVYAGTDVGVYYSDDNGLTWKGSGTGFWHRSIECFANGANGTIYAGTDAGLFKSSDDGETWSRCPSPQNVSNNLWHVVSLFVSHSETIYAQSRGNGISRSRDLAHSWSQLPLADSAIAAIQLDSSGNVLAGLLWGTILRSSDEGDTWAVRGSLPGSYPLLTMRSDGNGRILAGSKVGGVFRSSDNGITWIALGLRSHDVASLLIGPGGTLFAGTFNHGLFRSTNDGSRWDTINCAFSSGSVVSLMFAPGGTIYAGTTYGLYSSSNNGESWQADTNGIGNINVGTLILTSGGQILAGTGSGAYRSSIKAAVVSTGPNLPTGYLLFQNYPNPFNPRTTIRYGLPRRSHVSFSVYNTLGQEVAQLVSGDQDAGVHEVRFDGSGLSSGVYLYRMRAGDFVETLKSLLLK